MGQVRNEEGKVREIAKERSKGIIKEQRREEDRQ